MCVGAVDVALALTLAVIHHRLGRDTHCHNVQDEAYDGHVHQLSAPRCPYTLHSIPELVDAIDLQPTGSVTPFSGSIPIVIPSRPAEASRAIRKKLSTATRTGNTEPWWWVCDARRGRHA